VKNLIYIAGITFKEIMRNRLLNVLLLFAIISIASTRFFTIFAPSEEMKIIQDTALGMIRFIGMLITVFICGSLLPREAERRTTVTVLSKPVRRTQFFLGKFAGSLYAIFLSLGLMALILYILVFFKYGHLDTADSAEAFFIAANLAKALFMIVMELVVIGSIAIAVSTFTSEIFSVTFGILVFIIGHLANYLQHISDRMELLPLKVVTLLVYYILPHLENFNVQNAIVLGQEVSLFYIFKAASYGLLYTAVMLILGSLLFSEKEF